MRIINNLRLLIFVLTIMLMSCTEEGEPSAKSAYLKRLKSTWQIESVMLGDMDVTEVFDEMTLTINGDKTFEVTNGNEPIWPVDGSFLLEKLPAGEHYMIRRSDGVDVTVTGLTTNRLNFEFQYEAETGRALGLSGVFTFVMSR